MEGGEPFAEIEHGDLEDTVLRADKRLQAQRGGLDSGSNPTSGSNKERVTREKNSSLGNASGSFSVGAEAGVGLGCTGLFPHMDGWIYVCEFEDCVSKSIIWGHLDNYLVI